MRRTNLKKTTKNRRWPSRLGLVGLIAILFFSTVLTFVNAPTASAAACTSSQKNSDTYELNGDTIIHTGVRYSTTSVRGGSTCVNTSVNDIFTNDGSGLYYAPENSSAYTCKQRITLSGSGAGAATLEMQARASKGGGRGAPPPCGDVWPIRSSTSITVVDKQSDVACNQSTYAFSGNDIIATKTCAGGAGSLTFKGDSSGTKFTYTAVGTGAHALVQCTETITLAAAGSLTGTLTTGAPGSCAASSQAISSITGAAPTPTVAPAATDKSTIDCDFSGNPLTWFVCPVVDGMVSLINKADGFITSALLYNNTDANSTSNVFNTPQYYKAWSSIRVLATAIIVISGLIMVASQGLGMEILDAYTVRKVLPRLLVALIGISLSWPLMQFMVQFFNVFGVDIRNIIYAPFGGVAGSLGGGALTTGLTTLLLGGIFLGIMGALSFGLTALLAILTGFVIIVFRDIALTFIIVLAPIGIAGYILPNTQRLWKLWIDNFLGLLLMFPIIEAFIAIGHAFASVALSPDPSTGAFGGGTLQQIIGFCAYFAPYFLLPVAFKLATGAIGQIAGVMAGHGLGERLKKFRGGEVAKNTRDLKAGSRFNPQSRVTKALGGNMVNRVGSNVGAGVRGRFGFGATGAAARSNNAMLTADGAAKENAAFAAQMNNEGAMAALAFGGDARKLRQLKHYQGEDGETRLQSDLAAARSVGIDRRTQVAAAEALAKSGKVIGNRTEAQSLYETVGGGNAALEGAVKGNYQFTSRQVGRADIGRGSDREALKELNVSDLSRQKPKSLENLFGGSGGHPGDTPIAKAMAASALEGNDVETAHYASILHAAKDSPYTTPEQQEHLQAAIDYANQIHGVAMQRAAKTASDKQRGTGGDTDGTTGMPLGAPPPS